MSHSAEVYRFDMHAPERLKCNRTAVRTHAVAIAPRPPLTLRRLLLLLPFRCFPGQITQMFCTLTQIVRAQQMARPQHQTLSSRDRVSGSSAPLSTRFDTRSQHGSTKTGCWPLPRNGVVPSEGLQCCRRTRELEMKREQNIRKKCRTRTVATTRE